MNLGNAEHSVNKKFDGLIHNSEGRGRPRTVHSPILDSNHWGKAGNYLVRIPFRCVDRCGELRESKMERETGFEPATLSLEG